MRPIMTNPKVRRSVAAMALAACVCSSPALAQVPANCLSEADASIDQTVNKANVSRRAATESRTSESNTLQGYQIWYSAPSCRGSVVVNLDTSCMATQVYPRYGCSLSSLGMGTSVTENPR